MVTIAVGHRHTARRKRDLLDEPTERIPTFLDGALGPRPQHGRPERLRVDLVRRGHLALGGQRRELKLRGVALGSERRVHRHGVLLVEHAGDDLGAHGADALVEVGDDGGEPLALRGRLVDARVLEAHERVGDERLDVLGREYPLLDHVHHELVELLDADRDARAGRGVLLPGRAVVQVGGLGLLAALPHPHGAAARPAPEPRREQTALADPEAVLTVALAVLAVPVAQGALRLDPLEGGVVDRGLVCPPRDDGAVVDDVPTVRRRREDVLDVLRPPTARCVGAFDVGAAGRLDPFPGEALREAQAPVGTLRVLGEDALHGLEGGARLLGDHETLAAGAAVNGVAVGRVPVLPEPLLRLAPHPAHHVAAQFLAVPLGQTSEDRANELPKRAIPRVGLGERDHVDVGLVQRRERAQAVEHVPRDATERPDVEAVDAGRSLLAGHDRFALGLRPLDERKVRRPLLGGPPADAFVHEEVLGWDGHPVCGGASQDLFTLLLDALVLAGVRAAEVGGADEGHGGGSRAGVQVDIIFSGVQAARDWVSVRPPTGPCERRRDSAQARREAGRRPTG